MTITIFGATGMVGKHLVHLAISKGYQVKAYGRNIFNAGLTASDNLELVNGTLFDENDVADAITGSDAVLSALGGAIDGTDKTRSLGMKNIVQQMEKLGVNRIVAVGGMGCLDAPEEGLIMETPAYPKEYLAVGQEHYRAYEYLKSSSLEWTFVCPPDIQNEPATGLYHTEANTPPVPNNYKITAGDLAEFMLAALDKNNFPNSRVGISN